MTAQRNAYTHGHHESVLRSHRWRTAENSAAYLLPHLRAGQDLLDVGCGPGTITCDFADRGLRVTALEPTSDALDLCRAEAGVRGVDLAYATGDVHALPFADASFDVVHAHQVLQHVADPVQALREMWRVVRPGGVVAVRDSDYHGFVWAPASPSLDAWLALYQRLARANGGEPDAGRHLLRWAREAGLDEARVGSSTWCFATPEDRAWWGGMWADRVLQSRFAEQAYAEGAATREELEAIRDAWLEWADDPDGWLSVLHGELLARKG